MSVATHLRISPRQYDTKIRGLIPLYDELLAEAAGALHLASTRIRLIVDLGVGTGALAQACLAEVPAARLVGIDTDAAMMAMVARRLGRGASRVTLAHASFLEVDLPRCDAIVATYALHHIRDRRSKQRFYRRCHAALRPGGVLISGDCMPASARPAFARDLEVWFAHLTATFGSRAAAKRVYHSWAAEDVYVPLADETQMLERAGFTVDVPWRRSPFAVVAGLKAASR
jgi:SAM-dependent methyltransferase